MKISEELGDRSGIAITRGQMGKIQLVQKNYKEALRNFLFAFIIFDELKLPYQRFNNAIYNEAQGRNRRRTIQ